MSTQPVVRVGRGGMHHRTVAQEDALGHVVSLRLDDAGDTIAERSCAAFQVTLWRDRSPRYWCFFSVSAMLSGCVGDRTDRRSALADAAV